MKYILPICALLVGVTPSVEAISQYEVQDKPNQYQLAYESNTESMYIDLSTLHLKQDTENYKTVQARMISIYKNNQVIADYTTDFTFYKRTMGGTAPTMAWQISKPEFYALNGFPICTSPHQKITKDYGQHMVKSGSAYQRLGDYIYSTCNELQKITYTADNPYMPPKVFAPVVNKHSKDILFSILPPHNPERTPMDDVIPAGPPPHTIEQPILQPGHIGPSKAEMGAAFKRQQPPYDQDMVPPDAGMPFNNQPPYGPDMVPSDAGIPFNIQQPPYGPRPDEVWMDESNRYEPPRINMNQLGIARPPQRSTHAGPPSRR